MYMNQVEKTYTIHTGCGTHVIVDGREVLVDAALYPNMYKKAVADEFMYTRYRGLPYELRVAQDSWVATRMGNDPRWWVISQDGKGWAELEVDLGFGEGYFIEGMGTTEQCIKINLCATYYFDIYVKGKNITRVVHHSMEGSHECTNFCIPIDNAASRFFRATDRLFNDK